MLISSYRDNYGLYDTICIFITVAINRRYEDVFVFSGTNNDYS